MLDFDSNENSLLYGLILEKESNSFDELDDSYIDWNKESKSNETNEPNENINNTYNTLYASSTNTISIFGSNLFCNKCDRNAGNLSNEYVSIIPKPNLTFRNLNPTQLPLFSSRNIELPDDKPSIEVKRSFLQETEEIKISMNRSDVIVNQRDRENNSIENSLEQKDREIDVIKPAELLLEWIVNEILIPYHMNNGDKGSKIVPLFAEILLSSSSDLKESSIVSLKLLLHDDNLFNLVCRSIYDHILQLTNSCLTVRINREFEPFIIPSSLKLSSKILLENFVTFLDDIATITGIKFSKSLLEILRNYSMITCISLSESEEKELTLQHILFGSRSDKTIMIILSFLYKITRLNFLNGVLSDNSFLAMKPFDETIQTPISIEYWMNYQGVVISQSSARLKYDISSLDINILSPVKSPCPFELAVLSMPEIVSLVLLCLGDPGALCKLGMVNTFCHKIISEKEHILMKDCVRIGGLSNCQRAEFWMWVTLDKFQGISVKQNTIYEFDSREEDEVMLNKTINVNNSLPCKSFSILDNFQSLEKIGREGKWHSIIQRDVRRAFGNMPPHRTCRCRKSDSIFRALVTWSRSRLLKLDPKSERKERNIYSPLENRHNDHFVESEASIETSGMASEWDTTSSVESTVTNVFSDSNSSETQSHSDRTNSSGDIDDLVLSGVGLTCEMKVELQNKLGFILHAIAASHGKIGYCQGMDYVVAHLLRILHDSIQRKAQKVEHISNPFGHCLNTHVVEETIFRVMHTLLTTYNLRFMYWPELRFLRTCCRVFEVLIQKKLPVLADHFDHHELNVGLFDIGWFQTLFLYVPSMPSATINHIWDIWLVERSMKIFFRVGIAILYLSQPILLNHDLEGMMTYLNTFPDASLLSPDILVTCALEIKITNKMLAEIETNVVRGSELAHGKDMIDVTENDIGLCTCGPSNNRKITSH